MDIFHGNTVFMAKKELYMAEVAILSFLNSKVRFHDGLLEKASVHYRALGRSGKLGGLANLIMNIYQNRPWPSSSDGSGLGLNPSAF